MTKSNPRITRKTGRSLTDLLHLHRPCLPWRRCPLLRLSDLSSSPFAHHRYLARLRRDAVLQAAEKRATASLAGLVLSEFIAMKKPFNPDRYLLSLFYESGWICDSEPELSCEELIYLERLKLAKALRELLAQSGSGLHQC